MQLYSYQKIQDTYTTYLFTFPEDPAGVGFLGQELGTVGDITYVSLPLSVPLPVQPKEITVTKVTATPTLLGEIKSVSPHIRLIREQVKAKIREQYSPEEELKMLRIAPSPLTDNYKTYVQSCVDWGNVQKTKLGLSL